MGVPERTPNVPISSLAGCIAMNISNSTSGVSNTSSAASIKKIAAQPIEKQVPADAPKQLPITDRVELSGMSGLLKSLKAGPISAPTRSRTSKPRSKPARTSPTKSWTSRRIVCWMIC